MRDYALNESGDLTLENGDFKLVTNIPSLLQRLKQKFSLWNKEWIFDENAGFNWMDVVGQRPNPDVLRSLILQLIESDPDIRTVTELELENTPERKLRMSFTARTILSGEPLEVSMDL